MIFKTSYDVISISGAILALVGGYFLVRSIYSTTPHQISSMSGTYIGSNKHLELAFIEQKVDTIVGWALTFLGSTLSMISSFWNMELQSMRAVCLLAFCVLIASFISSILITKLLKKRILLKTRAITFTRHVGSYLRHNLDQFDAKKLIADAKRYEIESLIDNNISDHKNLANILKSSGATPGANQILELEGIQNGKK